MQHSTSDVLARAESLCKIWLLVGVFWALAQVPGNGQASDISNLGKRDKIIIPFTFENNFIVVRVTLNGRYSLRFVVDTGAENTILLDKRISDELDVDYRRKFTITGADQERDLIAYLATGIDLQLDDALLARSRAILVLEEDYANLDQVVGSPIHGILGVDFWSRFVMEINYRTREIRLKRATEFKPGPKYREVPSVFHRHRAYIQVPIAFSEPTASTRKLLLDTGAGITMLLHTYGDTIREQDLPVPTLPGYIANGIGGNVNGNVGRARQITLGGKTLADVITYFQPLDTLGKNYLHGRRGIIGNKVLSRYRIAIDFVRSKVYFRPDGRAMRQRFRFDRSGLSIVAGGRRLNQFYVARVVADSPAAVAGLCIGDRIASVNGTSCTFLSLGAIIERLRGKIGRRVRMKYVRDNQYIRTEFTLQELI
ncbi:aspartyl protease family protein [Neolewinella antarctica]|uniref:PDZ domain-containing protein n=1 Tax=Neolewinella antarctica TaxID=442734 RepID=A0ABX0X8P2_9BACT|nr:aspartyl protease family protein [Neolewinella antarctica]NJC25356.1 hypothetical protein [Neolewinella antarctica]